MEKLTVLALPRVSRSTCPNNSSADADGNITVAPGSRIPSIPRNSLHLRLDAEVLPGWQLGGNLVLNGPSYARGDENNGDANGPVPGYAVVNLDTTYRFSDRLSFFARINNLFDRHYANFGILGENVFANAARTFDPASARSEPFLGQGAPFGAWGGLRYEWD